jgi:hypothetical protein
MWPKSPSLNLQSCRGIWSVTCPGLSLDLTARILPRQAGRAVCTLVALILPRHWFLVAVRLHRMEPEMFSSGLLLPPRPLSTLLHPQLPSLRNDAAILRALVSVTDPSTSCPPSSSPAMDGQTIRDCIVATLDADADVRQGAELQLKQVRTPPLAASPRAARSKRPKAKLHCFARPRNTQVS